MGKTFWGARRWRVIVPLTALLLLVLAGSVLAATGAFSANDNPWPYAKRGPAPVLAAVGDISCQPGQPVEGEKQADVCDQTGRGDTTRNQAQTAAANQIEAMRPNLVAVLGDEQYQVGRYQDFMDSFNRVWGAFKFLQRPAPGNHEFYTSHGETGVAGYGYFDHYNGYRLRPDGTAVTHDFTDSAGKVISQPAPRNDGQAGEFGANGDGWYSYDLRAWHIISLNVECANQPSGCSPTGSWFASETQWLKRDLAGDRAKCTLAYWHQPTFSSTTSPTTAGSTEGATADAWWQLLYAHHADLVLNGHEHVYARFSPMDPPGAADAQKGIREFIIGTGGESLDTVLPSSPNLQAWADQYYGTMKLTLKPGGYAWDYESALRSPTAPAGTPERYGDTGVGSCHGGA
jgi:acid phosphatase type 7